MANVDYKEIAAIAQQRRNASIPSKYLLPDEKLTNLPQDVTTIPFTSGHFTEEEVEILESEAEDILQKISKKTWTAVEVTEVFCKAAVVAQQLASLPALISSFISESKILLIDQLPDRNTFHRGISKSARIR